jgi:hypothetical protein
MIVPFNFVPRDKAAAMFAAQAACAFRQGTVRLKERHAPLLHMVDGGRPWGMMSGPRDVRRPSAAPRPAATPALHTFKRLRRGDFGTRLGARRSAKIDKLAVPPRRGRGRAGKLPSRSAGHLGAGRSFGAAGSGRPGYAQP